MGPDVPGQVGRPGETFPTELALIFLLRRREGRRLGLEGVLVELQGGEPGGEAGAGRHGPAGGRP